MQVWRRDMQTGLRARECEDIVSMQLGDNSFDKYRVWGYMNDESGAGFRWGHRCMVARCLGGVIIGRCYRDHRRSGEMWPSAEMSLKERLRGREDGRSHVETAAS